MLTPAVQVIKSTSFSPLSVSGCQLWLDAYQGVYTDAGTTLATNGQTVQQWNDKSSSARHAVQTTSVNFKPLYVTNVGGTQKPGIFFSGSTAPGVYTALVTGTSAQNADTTFTCFVVSKQQGLATDGITQNTIAAIISKGDFSPASNMSWCLFGTNGVNPDLQTNFFVAGGSSQPNNYSGTTVQTECWTLGKASSVNSLYKNSVLVGTSISTSSMNVGVKPLGIGGFPTSSNGFYGYIHEVLYYTPALSAANQALIESYLRNKWEVLGYQEQHMVGPDFGQIGLGITAGKYFKSTGTGGIYWDNPAGVSSSVITYLGHGGSSGSTSYDTQGDSWMFYKNKYWCAYEINDFGIGGSANTSVAAVFQNETGFNISNATSLAGPWSHVTTVILRSSGTGQAVWEPQWVINPLDSSINIIAFRSNANLDGALGCNIVPCIVTATDLNGLTTWTAAAPLTGSIPANLLDCFYVNPLISPYSSHTLWYTEYTNPAHGFPTSKGFGIMTASSIGGPYTVRVPANGTWFGYPAINAPPALDTPIEGITILKIAPHTWRAYYSPVVGSDIFNFYNDSTNDWATWSKRCGPVVQPTQVFMVEGDYHPHPTLP